MIALAPNTRTGLMAGGLAVAMVGLGFASVPLYRLFCQVTGLGGTTQLAEGPAPGTIGQSITVRFDANHAPTLPWSFAPEKAQQRVAIGERQIAFFTAKNLAGFPVKGTATFNVTPSQAGKYFNKIQCFCFTEQTLTPGKQVRMPVIFFVDPKIMDDPDARDINEITLSYTFYPVDGDENPS
jgi:cytochrome c oxidase assembly protein subunit 11